MRRRYLKQLSLVIIFAATLITGVFLTAKPVLANGEVYSYRQFNSTTWIQAQSGSLAGWYTATTFDNNAGTGIKAIEPTGTNTYSETLYRSGSGNQNCTTVLTINVNGTDKSIGTASLTSPDMSKSGCDGLSGPPAIDSNITIAGTPPAGSVDPGGSTGVNGNQTSYAASWALGDTHTIDANTKIDDITQICSEYYNNADVKTYDPAKYKLCVDNATAAQKAAASKGNANSCTIDGIGWIVCPVVRFMAKIVDAAYVFVSSLLVMQPLMTTGGTGDVYGVWKLMRNIANVLFIIGFVVVIFSQVSSIGISNYGIKKILPRLIIAAILVNASYWICAIGVDLSNVAGAAVRGLFTTVTQSMTVDVSKLDTGKVGSVWTDAAVYLIGGAALTGVVLYVGLSALIPALISAIVAILVVFLVLTLRQALIILLVVVSPLAFVAILLPNTESLFKKWREMLQGLLLMYPIIAGLFGASALASAVVMNTASGDFKIVIQIMGALMGILPLALTPLVMKSAGGLLNRFAGIVNNPNKGPIDRLRKGADDFRKRQEGRREIRALSGGNVFGAGRFQRRARRSAVSKGIESEVARAQAGYVAGEAQNVDAFRNQLAGGTRFGPGRTADPEATQRALANAISTQAKLEIDEVKASSVVIEKAHLDTKQMADLATSGTARDSSGSVVMTAAPGSSMRRAAIEKAAQSDFESAAALLDHAATGGFDAEELKTLTSSLRSSSSRPTFLGEGMLQGIEHGTLRQDTDALMAAGVKANAYSTSKIATGDKDELARAFTVALTNATITASERKKLGDNARAIDTVDQLKTQVGKNKDSVQSLKSLR